MTITADEKHRSMELTNTTRPEDSLEGIAIIDCDAHFTEPPDLWSARVPASMRSSVPEMRTIDGVTAWYLNGDRWANTGGNTIVPTEQKVLGAHTVQPFDAMDRSCWDVAARLALLDRIGVWAQIVYPNGIGFSSNHIFAIEDLGQRAEVLRIYNDFYVDIQQESGGRLLPQALLPIWDMDLTVKEMTRLLDKGMTGFTLSDKPELLGLPELPEPFFDPMWDLFNESGAVTNFHIGAGLRRAEVEAGRSMAAVYGKQIFDQNIVPASEAPAAAAAAWRSFGKQRRLAVTATQMYMSNVRIITNFCLSDMFDRFPRLKVVSAESGIGWIPFLLEAMEWQFDEMLSEPAEIGMTQRRPVEYFRDHVWVMFWFEESGPKRLVQDIGARNILVETDIPHPTCLYPGTRKHFANVLGDLSEGDRRRILQDNAAELYGVRLPVPR